MSIVKFNMVAARFEKFLLTTLVGFLFSLVVGLQGCATTSGPLFKESPVPEGKAVLYFYREWAFKGAALNHELYVNGDYLTEVTAGGYIPYVVDPGQVNIVTTQLRSKFFRDTGIQSEPLGEMESRSHGNLGPGNMEVNANEVYYFKYKLWSRGFKLRQVPQEIGKQEIQGLNLLPSPPDSQDHQTSVRGGDAPQ